MSGSEPEHLRPKRARINSIDLLRGFVMVIMMLDHTRDFVHRDFLQGIDPTDLSRTNVVPFFTRWITHFCAPVFVVLAGTGAYLQLIRGMSKRDLSRFLITRGLWLILLEFTVVRISVFFNMNYIFLGVMQVIWVIGVSMILLAALIHLPLRVVAGFGIGMIALHNLLDRYKVQGGWQGPDSPVPSYWSKLYFILHQPFEAFPVLGFPSPVVAVIYPLIPWVGVMAAGYAFGALYQLDAQRRRRILITIGSVGTALFIILRGINLYGDHSYWSSQNSAVFTFLSWLNTTKYPPSLLFLLMTLGPAMFALAWFESNQNAPTEPERVRQSLGGQIRNAFITFGRVPLFFYLLQWLTAHFISVLVHLAAGKPIKWMFDSQTGFPGPPAPGSGFNLAVVYGCWIVGVLLLYPVCRWFAGVKQRRRNWWLSYL
ncbi:MAG: DUF1624 domain-containing protein [Pyrinomonadaceae bacterium]